MARIPIFRRLHEGYGDARRVMRRYSYARCFGSVDPRWPGEVRAGVQMIASSLYSGPLGFSEPPVKCVEWEDSGGLPLILVTGDAKTLKWQNGVGQADTTLSATATDAELHDDGSGIPYYYTCYGGGGSSTKVERRDRAAVMTGPFTNLKADKLLSLSNDLYITATPASGTASCGVGKIAAGTSIGLAVAQPSLTVVGRATTNINRLAAIKNRACALKPEGIFLYDRATDTWVNFYWPASFQTHPDNGKVFGYAPNGDLIIAMGSGGAVRFDGENVYPYDLLPRGISSPNADTTPQQVAAMATTRHYELIVTQPGTKRSKGGGSETATGNPTLAKSTDAGATWASDYSSNVTDASTTSVATLDALVAASGKVVIGHKQPFAGFKLSLAAAKFNSNSATLSAEIWTGSAWASIGVYDRTATGAGGDVSLGRTGWVWFASDPVAAGWQTKSETIGGQARTRYYVRLTWSANLSATVQPHTLELAPYRPLVDPALTAGGGFGVDGLDRSGAVAHVLNSYVDDQGRHVVHDMGTGGSSDGSAGGFKIGDEIGCAVYAAGKSVLSNDDRMPVFFGREAVYTMRVSSDDRPNASDWPMLAESGLIESPMINIDDEVQAQQPVEAWKADRLLIDGRDWHATGYAYVRFDDGERYERVGVFDALPVELPIDSRRAGRDVQVAVGWTMTPTQQYSAGHPRFTCDLEVSPASGKPRRLPRQTPPVV